VLWNPSWGEGEGERLPKSPEIPPQQAKIGLPPQHAKKIARAGDPGLAGDPEIAKIGN